MREGQSGARTPLPANVGPYRIEGRLGAGGMGQVFRAWDQRLQRPVAIKHVLKDVASDPKVRERFRREAKATARLNHRAIVRIYDILDNEDGDWIIMELVEGQSLKQLLKRRSVSIRSVLRLAREIADGLQAAHEEGIVHRDLKLENVMVSESGRAKILDFGLAKSLAEGPEEAALSMHGAVMGTVRTMSPEQAQGRTVDHRSDLFSFGVLLFEMVTGQSPFRADNEVATLKRICRERHPSVRTLNTSCPETLAQLIDDLLEKDVEARPQSAREVAKRVDDMLRGYEDERPERSGIFMKTLIACRLVNQDEIVQDLDRTGAYADLGDARWYKVLARHNRVVRDLMASHKAFELDHDDDGFLLLTDHPTAAVRFALSYHEALADLAFEMSLPFRAVVGIHVGQLFLSENTKDDIACGARPREAAGPGRAALQAVLRLAQPHQTLLTVQAAEEARHELDEEPEELVWTDHGAFPGGSAGDLHLVEVASAGAAPLLPPRLAVRYAPVREATPAPPPSGTHAVTAERAPPAPTPVVAKRKWWPALFAAFVLGGLIGSAATFLVRSPPAAPAAAIEDTLPSVAVLNFHNMSGESADWLAVALAEMFSVDLVGSETFRLVPGEKLARLAGELPPGPLTEETLRMAGRRLGADFVVAGDYEVVTGDANADGDRIVLRLLIADGSSGIVLERFEHSGRRNELLDFVGAAGQRLRDALAALERAEP